MNIIMNLGNLRLFKLITQQQHKEIPLYDSAIMLNQLPEFCENTIKLQTYTNQI
jgi:hypothetical protein